MNSPIPPSVFETEPSEVYSEVSDDREREAFDPREADALEGDFEFDQEFASRGEVGRIIDLTASADRRNRKGIRDPRKVHALVLHQMGCCFSPREPLNRFLTTRAHFVITADGRILQLHPINAFLWASNGFNPYSVAVEFAGNFPDTSGKWWEGVKFGRNRPTQAQLEAGRCLVRHLIRTMGLKTILAHRQSCTKTNDPGPDVWYHVAQWAIENCGLNDGGPGFKIGTGNPIPNLWRTWGRVSGEVDFPQEIRGKLEPEDSFGETAEDSSFGEVTSSSQNRIPNNLEGPVGPFGLLTVRGRPNFRYAFTAEDAVWLARFVTGEAGGRDDSGSRAVIWAMFNRYAFFTHRVYPTFSRFLRAYSTPLQAVLNSGGAAARHYQNPDYVQTGGNYTGRFAGIPRGQLGRFLRLQSTPWRSLAASARGLAERALRGQLPNPIGNASEFANTAVYYRQKYGQWPGMDQFRAYNISLGQQKRWTWIGDVQNLPQYRRNTFFIDNRVARLPQGAVVVTLPSGAQPEMGLLENEMFEMPFGEHEGNY